jgi:histidinol-phosphatase
VDERALTAEALPGDPAEDLAFALHLADLAARVTLAAFGGRQRVELKPDATPVTAVDVAAERAIRDEITATYPDDGVLGEEHGLEVRAGERVWIVDPIDGTKLFAEGIPLWTTLIGLRAGGRVVAGVADAPALGTRYHASAGRGAFRGEEPLAVSGVSRLADAFVVHSPIDEWVAAGHLDALVRVTSAARATRGLSDAWAHLLVAQGSADALVEHEPCFEWDFAATSVIVEEAGGRITTFDGAPPVAGRGLVVTNGAVHAETLGVLAG